MKILSNLINQELSLIELDNIMQKNLFYSIMDDGAIDNIKSDKNIYYLSSIDNETSVIISFDIIKHPYDR